MATVAIESPETLQNTICEMDTSYNHQKDYKRYRVYSGVCSVFISFGKLFPEKVENNGRVFASEKNNDLIIMHGHYFQE